MPNVSDILSPITSATAMKPVEMEKTGDPDVPDPAAAKVRPGRILAHVQILEILTADERAPTVCHRDLGEALAHPPIGPTRRRFLVLELLQCTVRSVLPNCRGTTLSALQLATASVIAYGLGEGVMKELLEPAGMIILQAITRQEGQLGQPEADVTRLLELLLVTDMLSGRGDIGGHLFVLPHLLSGLRLLWSNIDPGIVPMDSDAEVCWLYACVHD